MRILTIREALQLAELVTGVSADVLANYSRIDSLDSALHAPFIGFGDVEVYKSFELQAAVLCSRIVRNHPLPDGNKRLGWVALLMFCDLNCYDISFEPSQVIALFVMIASSEVPENEIADWLSRHLSFRELSGAHTCPV